MVPGGGEGFLVGGDRPRVLAAQGAGGGFLAAKGGGLAVVFVTNWSPTSSRIWPRTAGTITSLVWFCSARLLYVLALSACT